MPRGTSRKPPVKPNKSSSRKKLSLVSFVVHSINRLRGKPSTDYQDALYQRQHVEIRNPWKAVEVVSEFRSCAASKQLKGKRFLGDEAPTLPLPGCTAANCNCRYRHFSDRRSGPRRADELGVHVHLMGNIPRDRRYIRGRRKEDG